MLHTAEGVIEIPIEEWEKIICEFLPGRGESGLYALGPPRVNTSNQTIEIDFAISSSEDTSPDQWYKTPKAVLQWEELEKPKARSE